VSRVGARGYVVREAKTACPLGLLPSGHYCHCRRCHRYRRPGLRSHSPPPSGRRPCLCRSCVGCEMVLSKVKAEQITDSVQLIAPRFFFASHSSHNCLAHRSNSIMANSSSNVSVAASQHHGRGLFATQAFMPNEVRDGGWWGGRQEVENLRHGRSLFGPCLPRRLQKRVVQGLL